MLLTNADHEKSMRVIPPHPEDTANRAKGAGGASVHSFRPAIVAIRRPHEC